MSPLESLLMGLIIAVGVTAGRLYALKRRKRELARRLSSLLGPDAPRLLEAAEEGVNRSIPRRWATLEKTLKGLLLILIALTLVVGLILLAG